MLREFPVWKKAKRSISRRSFGGWARDHECGNEKPKYNNYAGREVFIDVAVRVEPANEAPYEARMKVSLLKAYLLKPGVRVLVKYDPAKKEQVVMDDEAAQILERNPQLKK